jgi:hypothetical protein
MCLACQLTQRMVDIEGRLHPTRSEWLWAELAVLRERYALEDHPYLTARRRGPLSPSDLQLLATEYDHVVVATAAAARQARGVPAEVATLAEREIQRWRDFARTIGWSGNCAWFYGEDPFLETVALAQCLAGHDRMSEAEVVARLYAVRLAQTDGADRLTSLLEHALSTMAIEDPFAVLAVARETLESLWGFHDRLEASRVAVPEAAA